MGSPSQVEKGPAPFDGFKVIASSERKAERILTDRKTEIFNRHFQNIMNDKNIHLYNNFDESKASVVKSVIRTYKAKTWRYFTEEKRRYLMLPDMVYSYDHSVDRIIKTKLLLQNMRMKRDFGITGALMMALMFYDLLITSSK